MDEGKTIRSYRRRAARINDREDAMRAKNEDELRAMTETLRERLLHEEEIAITSEATAPIPFRSPRKRDTP